LASISQRKGEWLAVPTTQPAKVQLVTDPAKHPALTDATMRDHGGAEPFNETKRQFLLSRLAREMLVLLQVTFAVAQIADFLPTRK
jgi:hypothetical protein